MATTTVTTRVTRIRLKHNTSAAWAEKNPVLLSGELGFDTDSRYVKIGDGSTSWNDLSTVRLPASAIDGGSDFNTRYDIRIDSPGSKFTFLSSEDGSSWQDCKSFTCKDFGPEILAVAETLCAVSSDYLTSADKNDLEEDISGLDADAGRTKATLANVSSDYLKSSDKTELDGKITSVAGTVKMISTDYLQASDKEELDGKITSLDTRTAGLEGIIPAEATADNKLADKEFVNSSIATNTATFLGTFATSAEISSLEADANDYAFLSGVDQDGNTKFDRFKYSGTLSAWLYEYTLNNSSFTAAQWTTINSGATATKVALIDTNANNIASLQADKADKAITLSGYGIGDAYTKTETDSAITDAVACSAPGAATNKTLTAVSNGDNGISFTFGDISITHGQVSDWGTEVSAIASAETAELASTHRLGDLKAMAYLSSVAASNVDDGAVTNAKIANSAVTGDKIANGAVTRVKIDSTYRQALANALSGITDTSTHDDVLSALAALKAAI